MSASGRDRRCNVARTGAFFAAILSIGSLTGCVTRQPALPAAGQVSAARLVPSPLLGQPFEVVPAQSELTVLVYRAGPLAALGHNHVIACRCVTGTLYLPRDPLRGSFDLRIAVEEFIVDDPALRASERSADFPPDVPDSARQGTRHNMLSAKQLNAAQYPDITLRAERLRHAASGGPDDLTADVLLRFRGQPREVSVAVSYAIRGGEIVVTGAFPLRQTDLGLTPFSALGGALRVRDDMSIRLRIVARRRLQ